MSARNIDLVTFENDSVVNQKSISLPIGKVSIRQTAILFSGILVTFLVFMTSDNLIMSGFVFAVFLGLGLIGSRVMAADQMIKSHLMLLVRGTSLDVKPEYLEKKKKKQQQQINNNATPNSKQEIESQKSNNELVNKVLSDIQSLLLLFKKKDIQQKEQHENDILQENDAQKISEYKRFSAKVELTDQNILNVSLYKKAKQNQTNNDHDDDDSNPVEKMLRNISKKQTAVKPPKENLTERVIITLDGKKLEQSQYAIKSDDVISLVLEKNSDVIYQVTATADDRDDQVMTV